MFFLARHIYPTYPRGVNTVLDKISLILIIVGALNWGSIGLFQLDLVAWLFGGQGAMLSRIIYTVIALAGVWAISMLFRDNAVTGGNGQ